MYYSTNEITICMINAVQTRVPCFNYVFTYYIYIYIHTTSLYIPVYYNIHIHTVYRYIPAFVFCMRHSVVVVWSLLPCTFDV